MPVSCGGAKGEHIRVCSYPAPDDAQLSHFCWCTGKQEICFSSSDILGQLMRLRRKFWLVSNSGARSMRF